MRMARQRGQATVEWIGLTVALALLLALAATWTARELRPPERPPPVVERVAWPLGSAPGVPLSLASLQLREGDAPFVHALKVAAGRVRYGFELWLLAQGSFNLGFVEGVGEYGVRVWNDRGASVLPGLPDFGQLHPGVIGRDLRAWVRKLRRLPLREAVEVGARDAGRVSADGLTQVTEWYLRRKVLQVLLGRAGAPRPPAEGSRRP